jgi:hypothetical protein
MALRDKLPEILIGSVIIAGGGWLISQTFVINRTVGALEAKLDAKLSENTGRIDRIAAVLPDVRIKIAKEELAKPLVTAVVVMDPIKTSKGKWVAGVHVIDAAAMTRNTYFVPVKGPDDKEVAWLASGAAFDADAEAVSFKILAAFSSDVGTPAPAPTYVLAQNSFVLRRPTAEYMKAFNEMLRGRAVSQQTAPIHASVGSWEKLSAELSKNPGKYEAQM